MQIVSPKTAKVFYHNGLDPTGFDFFKQGGKTRAVEVCAGIAVIIKMPDVSQPMLTGIFFEIFLLVLDGVGFSSLFIIS